MLDSQQARIGKKRSFLMFVGLVACGILLNILGTRINGWLNLLFYLDNIGTILTALGSRSSATFLQAKRSSLPLQTTSTAGC